MIFLGSAQSGPLMCLLISAVCPLMCLLISALCLLMFLHENKGFLGRTSVGTLVGTPRTLVGTPRSNSGRLVGALVGTLVGPQTVVGDGERGVSVGVMIDGFVVLLGFVVDRM